ncbi:hypothetical protein KSS87_004162, partial [Heliosperma pusillum]
SGKSKEETKGGSKLTERPEELRTSPSFIEYWVPVSFSYLQLEKYCETLIKHLVDFLTNGREASGKLLLLDKFLQEVKGKGFRVVIVFQNHSKSGLVVLRDILDDLLSRRLGGQSYVHIYRDSDRLKKRAACDLFNDKESGRFVMLMERCSCQSNIKLSSVDFVILFNSDWCPINDMKCLRKMSIEPAVDHLNVLRLYSTNSLEEKILTLAKEGTSLESNLFNFSHNVSHVLLLWGATFLFTRLADFHSQCTSIASLNCLTEDELLGNVFDELLVLLSCQDGKECSFSLISKVSEGTDQYHAGIIVPGDQNTPADGDIPPYVIWSSLLEEKSPKWRLLPRSSGKKRRRNEFNVRSTHYTESENENELPTNKKNPPSQGDVISKKSKSRKVLRLAHEKKAGKLAGGPNSADAGKELSPCKDGYNGTRHIEETCMRRMRDLLLKQKKEIREFYRTKREERARLEEEHQLELELNNQGCKEAGDKQEELKRLDHIYVEKVEEHNRQMDMKRKELEGAQHAKRIKEKQVKHKLIALAKAKHSRRPISSLLNESSLDFNLGLTGSSENVVNYPVKVPEEIETGIRDESVQHHDPGTPPVSLREDTEILSVASDGEDDGASMPAEVVLINIDDNDSPHISSTTASLLDSPVRKTLDISNREALDRDCIMEASGRASNEEFEGNSSTNIESCSEKMPGITVENQSYRDIGNNTAVLPKCHVSGPLESDGENDVVILCTGEMLDQGSNLGTSNEPQLLELSGQSHLNITNREGLDRDCTMEASGRASNEEVEGHVNEVLDSPSTVDGIPRAQEQVLVELPSPRVTSINTVLQQSQIVTAVDTSLPLEQTDVSACLLGNHARQNAEGSATFNSQTSDILGSRQLDQNQFPLRSGYSPTSLHSPVQSFIGCDQTHIPNSTCTAILQSPNSHFQDSSSFRSDMVPSTGIDPLDNELKKMQMEEEDARNIHKEKIMHVEAACEKEIEEVRKKYDLFRKEADAEYLQKSVALESIRVKVRANKCLADTLKLYSQKPRSPPASQEHLMNAILELPLLQEYNMSTRPSVATRVRPSLGPVQVQVVHQLSDLMSIEPVRLHNSLSSSSYPTLSPYPTLNPSAGHPARAPAPHLRSLSLMTPPIHMLGIPSLTDRPNQQHRSVPGNSWTRQYLVNAGLAHRDGSPCNPVI